MKVHSKSVVFVAVMVRWLKIGTFHTLDLTQTSLLAIALTQFLLWQKMFMIHPMIFAWVSHIVRSIIHYYPELVPATMQELRLTLPTHMDWLDDDVIDWYCRLTPHEDVFWFLSMRYGVSIPEILEFIQFMGSLRPGFYAIAHPVLAAVAKRDLL
jgi:hypothetical protein